MIARNTKADVHLLLKYQIREANIIGAWGTTTGLSSGPFCLLHESKHLIRSRKRPRDPMPSLPQFTFVLLRVDQMPLQVQNSWGGRRDGGLPGTKNGGARHCIVSRQGDPHGM